MIKRLYIRILLLVLLLPLSVKAQQKSGQALLDSLLLEVPEMQEDTNGVKLLDAVSFSYCTIDPDEGIKWAKKELLLARKIGWKKGEAWAYNMWGSNQQTKGNYPGALDAYFKALSVYETLGDRKGAVNLTSNIGQIYFLQEKYDEALQWEFKAVALSEETGHKRIMVISLGNISMIYFRMGNDAKALEYQLKANLLAEQLGNPSILGQMMGNTALIYIASRQYNLALAYTFKALRVARKNGEQQFSVSQLANAGISYWLISKGDSAIVADSLVPATRAANLTRAVAYLQSALTSAKEAQYLQLLPEIALPLSGALETKGDYKGALAAYKQYTEAKDSLYSMESREKIAAIETKRALQLKDRDIEIAKLAVGKKRNERVFFIAGIALLLTILLIILYNFRRHERSRRRIKELQDYKISLLDETVKRRTEQIGSMRQTIATDFHDQTGNMLAAITRQAATLELRLLHQPEVLPVVRSIIHNAHELYASSKDFLWNLNHDSDDPLVLFQYLSGYGQRYYNQFDISFSSAAKGDEQPHMNLPPLAGLNLIYIFKEAMSNVIKHSGADEVSIELLWEADRITYALQDNGTWKEADTSTEHYGLSNMERRSRQSGFDYSLSNSAAGTRIALVLPMTREIPPELG